MGLSNGVCKVTGLPGTRDDETGATECACTSPLMGIDCDGTPKLDDPEAEQLRQDLRREAARLERLRHSQPTWPAASTDELFRRYGYEPKRPVGRDDEIPDRLIRNMGDIAADLSPRELDVLRYASRGLSKDMTATAMVVAPETVKSHLEHARLKLRSKTTTQACCDALRRGLID